MKSNNSNNILDNNLELLKADELYCKNNCSDELLVALKFTYREITIIKLRWNESRTFGKIGYEVGLSPERVRVLYTRMKSRIIEVLNLNTNCIDKKILITNQFKTKLVNILKQKGIHTLEDIASYTKQELLHINQIGENTINSIEKSLKENGLAFTELAT